MMTDDDVRTIFGKLRSYYLSGDVTGPAFAWLVESLIATSGIEDRDSDLAAVADFIAAYSPSGGDGLYDEAELRQYIASLARLRRDDGAST